MRMLNATGLGLITGQHIDEAGLKIITTNEGDKHQAYRDIRGIPTIGYGHTGPDVHMGMVITEAQALALLRMDLGRFEASVENVTHDVPTTENQFSAMVSLTYNIGAGAFRSSTVLSAHRQGHYDTAGAAFLFWDKSHVNGMLVVVNGLLRRRNEERKLYLTPDAVQAPAPGAPVVGSAAGAV